MRRLPWLLLPGLLATLTGARAEAYTLRKSAGGTPARWADPVVEVVIDGSVAGMHPQAVSAVTTALSTWDGVADTSPPSIVIAQGTADELGYRPGSDNHSTVRYAPDGSDVAGNALAVTVVTFDSSGKILDADIVINGGTPRPWTVEDRPVVAGLAMAPPGEGAYDVQNVVTHEAGHLLGFGEELQDHDATMFVSSGRGEIKKRVLKASDIAGLHVLYDGAAAAAAPASGSCSIGRAPARPGAGWLGLAVVAAGLGLALGAASRRRGGARGGLVAGTAFVALAAGVAPPIAAGAAHLGTSAPANRLLADADVVATVVRAQPRWEGGLVVTRLVLRPTECHLASCPSDDVAVEVFGGAMDGLTQVVGHGTVPRAGASLPLAVRAGRLVVPKAALLSLRGAPTTTTDGEPNDRSGGPAVPPAPAKVDPRRLHERAPADLPATIAIGEERAGGFVENLSEGGLFVATDGVAQPGEVVGVEFNLPGLEQPVRASAEVRWTRGATADGEVGGMGLRFVDLGGDAAEAIGRYVAARVP
jgi:uncharacterized protein (TIGR02266 family)